MTASIAAGSSVLAEAEKPIIVPSDCSITTIGNRPRRSSVDVKETTVLVLEDLLEESRFFCENRPRLLPTFDSLGEFVTASVFASYYS